MKNEQHLLRALRAGTLGYVLTEAGALDLVRAVGRVARGRLAVAWPDDATILELLLHAARCRLEPPRQSTLTKRERDVLRMVARGYSNAEIARQWGISPTAVDTHRTHVMAKLDLHSRADITSYALQQGYLIVA